MTWEMELVIGLWIFALGACIGSFLNVVVYRVPARLNIAWPGSRCPSCLKAIRGFDNIPIVSWLVLRGKCRDCALPISPRYPLVEGTTALLFLLLAVIELQSGGANLPVRGTGRVWGEWLADPSFLAGLFVCHALLLATLLSAALIAYDGHRVPVAVVLPMILVGLMLPMIWPQLRPVSVNEKLADVPVDAGATMRQVVGLLEGFMGLAGGAIAALATRPLGARDPLARARWWGILWGSLAIGAMLGWQAAVWIAAAASLVQLALALLMPGRYAEGKLPWLAAALMTTLLWLAGWGQLVAWFPWLGEAAGTWSMIGAAAVSAVASSLLSRNPPKPA